MEKPIIDLHCHSMMKQYALGFPNANGPGPNSPNPNLKNSSWWVDRPTPQDIADNQNGLIKYTKFTQAAPRQCTEGSVRIIFNSIYPIEQSFVNTIIGSGAAIQDLINCISGLGDNRIDYIEKINDYFPDLENEYDFIKQLDGASIPINGAVHKYKFVKNYQDLQDFINNDPAQQKVAVINTIEGGHSLGTGIRPFRARYRKQEILDRIKKIKQWDFPPLFMTLAHHFYNELCGHAKSLGLAALLTPQGKGAYKGPTQLGEAVVESLLSTQNGKRILIDVKHMSLKSRIWYYRKVKNKGIPIIVSHGGVTGSSNQGNPSPIAGASKIFNSRNINFHDFELFEFQKSGGLFGIQLDERRIGKKRHVKKHIKNKTGTALLIGATKLIWHQIQHIAEVLNSANLNAWDIQCIGSDFDGIINPIDGYYTYTDLTTLRLHLIQHAEDYLKSKRAKVLKPQNQMTGVQIIDKFLADNADGFLKRWFGGMIV